MKKILFPIFLVPFFCFSQIPSGYYDAATGLSGYALKSKLHDIISKKTYSYNYSDVNDFYATTDLDKYYENDNTVLDVYSEIPTGTDSYNYNLTQNVGSASAEGQGFNREHGMPQSTYYGIYPMYSDIHYLIPADAFINQKRSNYPYARNNGSNTIFSNGSKLGSSTTPGYSNLVYEPIDEFKGDIARYLLYFATRYQGSLSTFNYMLSTCPLDGSEEKAYEDWYITMLKDWNTLDPVSQREIDRNNAVYAIEKTRNPFIDHPEYVNMIWSETTDTIAPNAPTNLVASQTGESFVTLNWQPSTDTDILGYKIYVNGVLTDYTSTNSITIDRLTAATTYNFTVKAYDKGYLLSTDSQVSATTLGSDTFAKDLMITKYIEGSTNNTALEIMNKTGHEVKLTNYYLSIQFKGANNTYYFSDTYKLEGKIAPNQRIVVVNPKSTFVDFPASNGDFVTSGTPMNFTGTQYIELSYGTKYLKTVSTNNYDMNYVTVDAVGFKDTSNTNGNVSLYRNDDVTDPNVNFTISEWTPHTSNYTVNLGVDSVLATSEMFADNTQRIYPNPAQDQLYILGKNTSSISRAEIYDLSGRLMNSYQQPFKNTNSISVINLKSGVYVLKLDSKDYLFIKK